MPTRASIAGVILAGGQSRRMGGVSKAFQLLGDRPMVEHVVERLRPQVDCMLLSVGSAAREFENFPIRQVTDLVRSHRGPLAGLYSAMHRLAEEGYDGWVLLVPCDAPFLPPDLGQRLLDAAQHQQLPIAAASYEGEPQPTFSLWHSRLLNDLRTAVLDKGQGGMRQVLRDRPHAEVVYATAPVPPFFNVNTTAQLEQAGRWLDQPPQQP